MNPPTVENKKSKTKPKSKSKGKQKTGSAKGIETMYRNAYRAELDLIALATTKSNIMISVNSFIVSALMISNGFIDVTQPILLVPAIVFFAAAVASMYFALLAASPDTVPLHIQLKDWFYDKFNLNYSTERQQDQSNILIYEDRLKLTKSEYLQQMRLLMTNPEAVYDSMSDQLYWLGHMANRKFELLKTSYSLFRWGIILSMLLFLAMMAKEHLFHSALHAKTHEIAQFKGIYEGSAVQQLPDGNVLVLEDESRRALNIVAFDKAGKAHENNNVDKQLVRSFKRDLSDLEGIAISAKGEVYATTSFSRTRRGKRRQKREQLLRFNINKNSLKNGVAYMDFGNLLRSTSIFDSLRQYNGGKAIDLNNINIEALSFDADKKQLLFGFREPQINGKSMIVRMKNPAQVFDHQAQPILSDDITLLDLDGGGIRSLVYDTHLEAYLIANEVKRNGKWTSQLWLWNGERDQRPTPLAIPDVAKMKNVEAVSPIVIDGVAKVLLVSDDGHKKKKRAAHYLLLDYQQIVP